MTEPSAPELESFVPTRVRVENFRRVKEAEFDLGGLRMLVGRNNSGKTAVIDAVRCFFGDHKFHHYADRRRGADPLYPTKVSLSFVGPSDTNLEVTWSWASDDGRAHLSSVGADVTAKDIKDGRLGRVVHVPSMSRLQDHVSTKKSALQQLLADLASQGLWHDHQRQLDALLDSARSHLDALGAGDLKNEFSKGLRGWRGEFDLDIHAPKFLTLLEQSLVLQLDGRPMSEYGSGFQRQLIAELLRMHASRSSGSGRRILLFEEPEVFLHPPKQREIAESLHTLAENELWTVLASTHSPLVLEHLAHSPEQRTIVRLDYRRDRGTQSYQPRHLHESLKDLRATAVKHATPAEAPDDFDECRWEVELNANAASMFFSDVVLLVEGATERVLFQRLLQDGVLDMPRQSVAVIETYGKFAMPRYLAILNAYRIPCLVVHDLDGPKHEEFNSWLGTKCEEANVTVAPIVLKPDLEGELGWSKPSRADLKPAYALSNYTNEPDADSIRKLCARIAAAATSLLRD